MFHREHLYVHNCRYKIVANPEVVVWLEVTREVIGNRSVRPGFIRQCELDD